MSIKHVAVSTCYGCCCCVCAVVLFSFVRCISTFKVQFPPSSCGCVCVLMWLLVKFAAAFNTHQTHHSHTHMHTHSTQRELPLPLPLRLHANLLLVTSKPTGQMAQLDSRTAGQLAATFISIAITIAAAFSLLGSVPLPFPFPASALLQYPSWQPSVPVPFVPAFGEANETSWMQNNDF